MSRAPKLCLLAAASILLACTGLARATTGSLELVHPPRVLVPFAKAGKFEGRYKLEKVGGGAQIRGGDLKVEFSPGSVPEFLIGAAQFSEYNAAGQPETALFTLYPFRSTADGVSASIYKKGIGTSGESLGTFEFDKPAGDLMEGTVELHGTGPFKVVFSRYAEGQRYTGNVSPAQQLPEAAEDAGQPGWGTEPSEFEGAYELIDPAPDATADSGLLGPVISATRDLGRAASPTAGSMTVEGGDKPTAEIEIKVGSFEQTLYLDELAHEGDRRVAKVHTGNTSGPIVGDFEGRQGAGPLSGILEVSGSRTKVSFEREGAAG